MCEFEKSVIITMFAILALASDHYPQQIRACTASALSIPCAARCMASIAERTMMGSAITAGGMPLMELLPLPLLAVAVAVALVLLLTLVPLPSFEPASGRVVAVNAAVAFNVSPASAPPRRTSSPHGCAANR